MKAVVCKAWGLPETLVIEEQAEVTPAAGEVMIDIMAAGVNFPDVLIIQNKYQFKPQLPFTPGNELAGIVRSVGEGVTKFQVSWRGVPREEPESERYLYLIINWITSCLVVPLTTESGIGQNPLTLYFGVS